MRVGAFLVVFAVAGAVAHAREGTRVMDPTEGGYRLVWSDEFDRAGKPDPKNWTYENGFVRNNELQYYRPENAFCTKGFLIIEGRRERLANPAYKPGSNNWKEKREYAEYTAASMKTSGLHSWLYGRFVMRARIPAEPGMWPAFWTLGSAREWPSCGEIDIMEYYKGGIMANVAWGTARRWNAKWDSSRTSVTDLGDANWKNEFHVWRMDWTPDSIKLYIDDRLLNETSLSKTTNSSADHKNPFHEPQYILVNLAIGGNCGGDPSKTKFPQQYIIDYVRVYQLK